MNKPILRFTPRAVHFLVLAGTTVLIAAAIPALPRLLILAPTALLIGIGLQLDRERALAKAALAGSVADLVRHQHHLDARMIQADRLAAIGSLAAGMAHEINNPLAFVIANLGYARDELAQQPMRTELGTILEALDESEQGAIRVSGIIRDLKSFSEPHRDDLAAVDVRRVIASSINMCRHALRKSAELIEDYGDVPPVLASEARLGQVFLSLLVNAVQAIPPPVEDSRGTIRIATRLEEPKTVRIDLSDDGAGIPEEILPRVFDLFFSTKPPGAGTGLGLSISQALVHGFGGTIVLSSAPGKGTTVTVRLPVCEQPVVPRRSTSPARASA